VNTAFRKYSNKCKQNIKIQRILLVIVQMSAWPTARPLDVCDIRYMGQFTYGALYVQGIRCLVLHIHYIRHPGHIRCLEN